MEAVVIPVAGYNCWKSKGELPAREALAGPIRAATTRDEHVFAAVVARQQGKYVTALYLFRRALDLHEETPCPAELIQMERLCHATLKKCLARVTRDDVPALTDAMRQQRRFREQMRRQEKLRRVCQPIRPSVAAQYLLLKHLEQGRRPDETPLLSRDRIQRELFVAESAHFCKFRLPLFTERPEAKENGPAYPEAGIILKQMCPDEGVDYVAHMGVAIPVTPQVMLSPVEAPSDRGSPMHMPAVHSPAVGSPRRNFIDRVECVASSWRQDGSSSPRLRSHVVRILDAVHTTLADRSSEDLIDLSHLEPPWRMCARDAPIRAMDAYYTADRGHTHPVLSAVLDRSHTQRLLQVDAAK
eukprot:m.6322 g.6322  ORF g.6322 m.6322 type:complete len:357 (-) comp2088_c0_seq1:294-1364(-)